MLRHLGIPPEENAYYSLDDYNVLMKETIFTFGSNLAGRHGKGAAKTAYRKYGAIYGVGAGHMGDCYGIPTKDYRLRILPLEEIERNVNIFKLYQLRHPEHSFYITPIGTGEAGYKHAEIAPMFKGVKNSWLPDVWKPYLEETDNV